MSLNHLLSLFILTGSLLLTTTAKSQGLLLDVNGNQPSPYIDHTGLHVLTPVAGMTTNTDTLEFTTGDDYLQIDNFASFDLDSCWTLELDLKVSNANNPLAILDWRSTSLTGHMQWAYDSTKGIYFSDRFINGVFGSLIADSMPLPNNQWVTLKLEKSIDSFFIYRDGNLTAAVEFTGTALSPVSTTTIGYSLDFRYAHATFYMDNLKFYACSKPLSYSLIEQHDLLFDVYPNPTNSSCNIRLDQIYNNIELELLNLQGQVIQQIKYNQKQHLDLDLSKLKAGIYFAKILFDNKITSIRIVKME